MTEVNMYDTIFVQGQEARRFGKRLADCPFSDDTFAKNAWGAGWADEDMVFLSEQVRIEPERIICADCGADIINDGGTCFYCETMSEQKQR